jgi:hypothetical protein
MLSVPCPKQARNRPLLTATETLSLVNLQINSGAINLKIMVNNTRADRRAFSFHGVAQDDLPALYLAKMSAVQVCLSI